MESGFIDLTPSERHPISDGVSLIWYGDRDVVHFCLNTGSPDELDIWADALARTLAQWHEDKPYAILHEFKRSDDVTAAQNILEEITVPMRTKQGKTAFIMPKNTGSLRLKSDIENQTNRFFDIKLRFFYDVPSALRWVSTTY